MNVLPKIAQKMSRHLFGIALFTGLVLPLAARAAGAPPASNAVQSV
jgi:type IV pilus assembly protein PilQ